MQYAGDRSATAEGLATPLTIHGVARAFLGLSLALPLQHSQLVSYKWETLAHSASDREACQGSLVEMVSRSQRLSQLDGWSLGSIPMTVPLYKVLELGFQFFSLGTKC